MATLLSILLLCSTLSATAHNDSVIRAAIDIGMGGPKLQIAKIDIKTNKIIKIVHTQRYYVNFYDGILKDSNNLSSEIILEGHKAFKDAVKVAQSFGSEGIIAIATASFRSAANGTQFAKEIQAETGVKVHIIDQDLEGRLAFQAILSKIDVNAKDLVVWDIGGGSMQFTALEPDGSYLVDCGNKGVGAFIDHIVDQIQHRKIEKFTSPNPMSADDITQAVAYAFQLSSEVDQVFKDRISRPTSTIVGAGSVFGFSIAGILANKYSFSLGDLAKVVKSLEGKKDADFGQGNYDFCNGTNAILVYGLMQALNIKEMQIINVNNTDGAVIYEPFWQ